MPMDFLAKSDPKSNMTSLKPWKVLIVDDDQDVHETTRIALAGCRPDNRVLRLYHAQSTEEAKAILSKNEDMAVALIDVVMETHTAGLDLVEWIRGELGNSFIRLILRTGQPGYAPRMDVIERYEIDGYKEKQELTRSKLIAAIITALRGYKLLMSVETNRKNLQTLNKHFYELVEKDDLAQFGTALLGQISHLIGVAPEGLVCAADRDADLSDIRTNTVRVLAAGGVYMSYIGRTLDAVTSDDIRIPIYQCVRSGENQLQPFGTCLALKAQTGLRAAIYIGIPFAVLQRLLGAEVLELFVINASLGYEKTALSEHIHRLAFEDRVTGLSSYTGFIERFRRLSSTGRPMTVVLLDIQRYRMIEHGIGEERAADFLKKVGMRLRSGFPTAFVIARKEVDEFIMLLDHVGAARMPDLVDLLEGLFDEPIAVGDSVFNIRMRMGIANSGDHGSDPEQLARYASIALNDLRQKGVGNYAVFTPAMQESAFERLRLTSLLTGTAGKTQFLLHYQPIIEASSGLVYSCEALMRFRTTGGDFLNTQRMIEAAEASGMIIDVGGWMIQNAVAEFSGLPDFPPSVHLNLNLSPKQVQSSRIYNDVERALELTGTSMSRLIFEVTEGIFVNNDPEIISFLSWIREKGGKVVIDDFGTGYSSFSYLRKLPVDGIKVDRAFIMNMDQDEDALAVVKSIIAVAQALGLEVTAEGVETVPQQNLLRELGCTYLQGYLYSRPIPSGELIGFVEGAEYQSTVNGVEIVQSGIGQSS